MVVEKEKGDKRARQGEARSPAVPKYPFEVLHLDWITGLPVTPQGHDRILVFVCALSGMVHVQAVKRTDTARDTARHMLNNIIRLYGLPRTVVSDRYHIVAFPRITRQTHMCRHVLFVRLLSHHCIIVGPWLICYSI